VGVLKKEMPTLVAITFFEMFPPPQTFSKISHDTCWVSKGKKKEKIRRDLYALLKPKAAQALPCIVNLLTHWDDVLFISKIEKN
jgi:hypothetical protein